jgi:hypothetical protein
MFGRLNDKRRFAIRNNKTCCSAIAVAATVMVWL